MGEEANLSDIAAACVLEQANSSSPAGVLAKYFSRVYEMGVQEGLRRTTESLDRMAQEAA